MKIMRIGFDAAPAFSSYSGIGQYVRSLFSAMFNLAPEIEWVGYAPTVVQKASHPLGDHPSVSYQHKIPIWKPRGFSGDPQIMDIFHGTNFKAPNCGQQYSVLTIHDLWLTRNPQYSKKLFGQALSSWKLGRRAIRMSKIIAVSEFSAQEIHAIFGVPRENIAVIHHGCSLDMYVDRHQEKFQQLGQRFGLPNRPYVLFVGGAEPRKNHRTLFAAFSQSKYLSSNFCLVAVGDVDTRGDNLFRTAHEFGISDVVRCPGLVTSEELRLLYSFAGVFVFPSLYEGFGIPILEAMACGAPVIATDRTAIPEIAGEAALYVDPHDVAQLVAKLERILSDETEQQKMREQGFQRARQFTWNRAAHETLSLYRKVTT
ncbi:MAG: glycosyltransferase family 4 protein [Nitrospirales bacterium]